MGHAGSDGTAGVIMMEDSAASTREDAAMRKRRDRGRRRTAVGRAVVTVRGGKLEKRKGGRRLGMG